MSARTDFTDEEWAAVLGAPMMAGFAVTAADPGGLVGVFQESAALARSMADAKAGAAEGSLTAEIVAAYQTSEGRGAARDAVRGLTRGKKPAEATEAAVAELGRVAALVRAKAPGDAAAFTGWLRDTAQKVAEAGTEGGFLGFGGEKVSDAERRTLADIDAALAGAGA